MRAQSEERCAGLQTEVKAGPPRAMEADDPFGADLPGDAVVVTTERRLRRLVIVACDAGVRSGQGRLDGDAVEWLYAPHAIFDGMRGIDGCQDRTAFVCASLVHGLALDFELAPEHVLALGAAAPEPHPDAGSSAVRRETPTAGGLGRTKDLFTCTLEGGADDAGRSVQAFCVVVAASEDEVRARLRLRYGLRLAEAAFVRRGFDPDAMLPRLLLGSALRRMLTVAAQDPAAAVCSDLDLHLEQRYVA